MNFCCKNERFKRIGNVLFMLILAFMAAHVQAFPSYTNSGPYIINNDTNTTKQLLIGKRGNGAVSLVITNNASVHVNNINISEAEGSSLEVTDNARLFAGSTSFAASEQASIVIGDIEDSLPALLLDEGAVVTAEHLYMGAASNELGMIQLNGEQSVLNIQSNAFIGEVSSDNKININDGATLKVQGVLNVGANDSSGNAVTVKDGGTLWVGALSNINVVGESEVSINSGATLEIGGDVNINDIGKADISRSSSANIAVNGHLVGTTIGNKNDKPLNMILNTSGSVWSNALIEQQVYIGNNDSYNSLVLTNGAQIRGDELHVGYTSDAKYNKLVVSSGSDVSVSSLYVGFKGSDNSISVEDSIVNVANTFTVGAVDGASNSAEVGSNALLSARTVVIGEGEKASYNSLVVSGSNSVIDVEHLTVGANGFNNTLNVSLGGSVLVQETLNVGLSGVKNSVSLSDSNTVLMVGQQLNLGSSLSTNNSITIDDHAKLMIDANDLSIAEGNNLVINDEGILSVSNWNFEAVNNTSLTNIMFNNGAFLEARGTLLGTNSVSGGLSYILNGSNANWVVDDDLEVNFIYPHDETYYGLLVLSGGYVESAGGMSLKNYSVLNVDSKSKVYVKGSYSQEKNSILALGVGADVMHTNLVVEGTADFEKESEIVLYDDGILGNTNIDVVVLSADKVTIGGEEAGFYLSGISVKTNGLIGFTYELKDNQLHIGDFVLRGFSELNGVDGVLESALIAFDRLRVDETNAPAVTMYNYMRSHYNESGMVQALDKLYGEKASTTPINSILNQSIGEFVSKLNVRSDSTRDRLVSATESAQAESVEGAEGPHYEGQKLQGWISGFSSSGDKSATDGYDQFDSKVSGFILGVDLSVAPNVLVGVAGGSASTEIDEENGASSDASSRIFSLYSSMGTKDWFLDGSFTLGNSSIDHDLGIAGVNSSYDAQNIALYVGGGKEIIGDYIVLTPRASLLVNMFEQDGYTETTTTNTISRVFDGSDAMYMQSSIGVDAAVYAMVGEVAVKPELRIHWLHEFNTDEESVKYRLAEGDGTSFQTKLQAPESDIIQLGAGVSAQLSESSEIRVDIDLRQGKDYSDHTVGGTFRYQF